MALQSIFLKSSLVVNHFNKLSLTNRINNVILVQPCMGMRQEAKEILSKLKIPEKPKRPMSPYFQFLAENRPIFVKENPSLSVNEVVKKLAEKWKKITLEEKIKYENVTRKDKAEYDQKILDYKASLTSEQANILKKIRQEIREDSKKRKMRKELRKENKPKRPPQPFALFLKEHAEKEGKFLRDVMVELKGTWAELPIEIKEKYIKRYQHEKKIFERDMELWESKMLAEGKSQFVRSKTLELIKTKTEEAPTTNKNK